MKRNLFNFTVNIIFGLVIIIIVIAVTTISLTKKINDYVAQNQQNIIATVEKNDVPVLSFTKGFVKAVNVREGQVVKKGDLLVEVSNPLLEQQVRVLLAVPDNASAQTEGQIAKIELQYNKVYAPVDGTIGDINTTVGSPVDEYSKLLHIYESTDTKLLAYLTVSQYQLATKMSKIPAFSQRINQDFYISPSILKPNQNLPTDSTNQLQPQVSEAPSNTIALLFKLNSSQDADSLLNGEKLNLDLSSHQNQVYKPIDYIVAFWNRLIK